MSLFRYNRLLKRGYRTVGGTNCTDPDFGNDWAELTMTNGRKLKRVTIKGSTTVREYMIFEKSTRGRLEEKTNE